MAPLGGVFSHQTEVRRTELPLVISAVAGVICGIGDPFAVHQQPDAPQLPKYKLIFGIPHKKFRTGSNDIAVLAITIQGRNDAPVGVNDGGTAVEAGGTANGTPGSNASGNVLTNDTDADTGSAGLTVTAVRTGATEGAGTAGTLGSALVGTYGSLTLNANGTYSYVVNNSNATVQALAVGQTLTESFNYTLSDGYLRACSEL